MVLLWGELLPPPPPRAGGGRRDHAAAAVSAGGPAAGLRGSPGEGGMRDPIGPWLPWGRWIFISFVVPVASSAGSATSRLPFCPPQAVSHGSSPRRCRGGFSSSVCGSWRGLWGGMVAADSSSPPSGSS